MSELKRIYKNFLSIQEYMGMRQIAAIAAATAFWFFLSIVPMVILAVSVLPYTSLSQDQLLRFLAPALPSSLNQLIASILEDVYQSSVAILSVSVAATLWSAARGFASLLRGLEEIYKQEVRSGFFMRRARGIVYTLAMLVFMLIAMVLGGFGRQIVRLAEIFVPTIHGLISWLLNFRFLVVIAMLTLLFMSIFRWGTGSLLRPKETFPGALFAALGWSILTWAFSAWVDVGGYGTYGHLATAVVVMLWLYYCQYALLLGACLNRAVSKALPRIREYRK